MSRQGLRAAAVLLAAATLWAPHAALAQFAPGTPEAAAHTPAPSTAAAPADQATANDGKTDDGKTADGKTGDAKPAEGQAADQQGKPGDGTAKVNLQGATVEGKRNAFDENDRKLKELQDSLPCNGCDAKPHTHKKLYKKVLDAVGNTVLPTEAPDHSAHDANDKSLEFIEEGNCTGANVKQCTPSNASP